MRLCVAGCCSKFQCVVTWPDYRPLSERKPFNIGLFWNSPRAPHKYCSVFNLKRELEGSSQKLCPPIPFQFLWTGGTLVTAEQRRTKQHTTTEHNTMHHASKFPFFCVEKSPFVIATLITPNTQERNATQHTATYCNMMHRTPHVRFFFRTDTLLWRPHWRKRWIEMRI